jgi:hypothetical protein
MNAAAARGSDARRSAAQLPAITSGFARSIQDAAGRQMRRWQRPVATRGCERMPKRPDLRILTSKEFADRTHGQHEAHGLRKKDEAVGRIESARTVVDGIDDHHR